MDSARTVLIVEDEDKLRRVLQLQLAGAGYSVLEAAHTEAALKIADRAGVVLTDLRLPGADGMALLETLSREHPQLPVIVMTAYGTVESAVAAMKAGAVDFLLKPFSGDHLVTVVEKALSLRSLRDENRRLRAELGRESDFEGLIGKSAAMREVFSTVIRVAPTRATVLLAGESGVGKDRIARAIHHQSPRRDRPFVKINCTALPENLMESELFGYEKGAFTGAIAAKPGKFEQADTGTVFLDEIGDVPPAVQVKLLRILQDRELERLGSNRTRAVDVRVIAATNVDLRVALENGTFREDLYYRLNVVPIDIPPLRARREDIPALVERFSGGVPVTAAAMEKLIAHHWPGNVRELENAIERSLILRSGDKLDAADVRLEAPRSRPVGDGFLPEGLTLEEHEQALIREALRRANGNKSQAARLLGLTRNALRYRLAQMGVADANGDRDDDHSGR
jgi:DNA-binding NtrC family response regulator